MRHIVKREFKTPLSQNQAIGQIKSRLSTSYFRSDSEFFGYTSENSFKITKNLAYSVPKFVRVRNSFSPVAIGRIEENGAETTVKLKVRMSLPVLALVLFIEVISMLGFFWSLLELMYSGINGDLQPIENVLMAVTVLLIIGMMVHFAFRIPARAMIKRLQTILLSDNICEV